MQREEVQSDPQRSQHEAPRNTDASIKECFGDDDNQRRDQGSLGKVVTMNLHIVTPCTRDQSFLDRCYESIRKLDIPYTWFIVTDKSSYPHELDITRYENTHHLESTLPKLWNSLLNYYLEVVPEEDQWMVVLDDDNLMHEGFKGILPFLDYPQISCVTYAQKVDKEGNLRQMDSSCFYPRKIDQAQFVLRRSDIGDLRYWNIYRGDGYFILEFKIRMEIRQRQILVTNQVACNYNAQHWT